MTVHDLNPSFVQIHYRSAYGKHVQTIQTRQWSPGVGSHGFGGYTTWLGASIDADTMVNNLVDKIKAFASDAVSWDEAIIFNYPSPPPTPPQPVALFALTQVGVVADVPAAQALQMTMNFYDFGFNTFKLVLLDLDCTGSFTPLNYGGLSAAKQDLADYIVGGTHAWASRADQQPATLRQVVWKYNDKLRKEYHLT